MATRTYFEDDYTGETLDDRERQQVTLRLDGEQWTLDLSSESRQALREALTPFLGEQTPTKVGKSGKAASSPHVVNEDRPGPTERKRSRDKGRAWMRENGWTDIPVRGRVPADALAAYEAAGGVWHEG